MKIYAAQINPTVGDISGNAEKIIAHIKSAEKSGADIAVFPELAIAGYPPEDLLLRPSFITEEQAALKKIAAASKKISVIIGATFTDKTGLHNAAWHLSKGKAVVVSAKADLPNYGVFDEKRYFKPSDLLKTITIKGKKVAVIVCEDSWTSAQTARYKKSKPDLFVVINASPFETGKLKARQAVIKKRVTESKADFIYVNLIGGQDGIVFDGGSFAMNKTGKITASLPQFEESGTIFKTLTPKLDKHEELYKTTLLGLRDYVTKNGFKKVLLGLSGGVDSALVATIAVDALGKENVRLVVLPTRFTSKTTYDDAYQICKNLGIKPEQIDIEPAFKAFEQMLAKNFEGSKPGLAEENLQSRIRGTVLMAISNKHNEMLLTTGNKSEIAVGYTTLYGDSCGGYNPIKDLYKTEVYEICHWRNQQGEIIPKNILTKAPTAELRENQTDQDSLPPYDVLDKILKLLIEQRKSVKEITAKGFPKEIVEKVAKLLYRAEYKRFQSAPGAKLSLTAFGKDWRYPLTNKYNK